MGLASTREAGDESAVTSITKYVPYDGIPHAGGQYLIQHYAALAANHRLELLAPSTTLNRAAIRGVVPSLRSAELVQGRGLFRGGRFKTIGDIDSVLRGSAAPRDFQADLVRNPAVRRQLVRSPIIEFQWSEMASLAPLVREIAPASKLVFVAHDVITQRWRRAAEERPGSISKAAFVAAARRSRPRERRTIEAVDLVIAFSDKDAALVEELAPGAKVSVVSPGLGRSDLVSASPMSAKEPMVLFTGAMNRPDNSEGAGWFLDFVWPEVRAAVPGVRFVIAGAKPPQRLVQRVAREEDVELTGYVDSLEPYYADASVFVSPIFTGAGVKFKNIDAMLRGVPIVSTPVGAEGVGEVGHYAATTDDAHEFAAAIVRELREPNAVRTLRTREWAAQQYGFPAFARRLNDEYAALLG